MLLFQRHMILPLFFFFSITSNHVDAASAAKYPRFLLSSSSLVKDIESIKGSSSSSNHDKVPIIYPTSFTREEETSNPKSSSSASAASSILSTLIVSVSKHVTRQRLFDITWTGIQMGIIIYLVKTIWMAVGDVLEELQQEMSSSTSSNRWKEDHDLPFLKGDYVDSLLLPLSNSTNTITNRTIPSSPNYQQQNNNRKSSHSMNPSSSSTTYHLAIRLHAAGIPFTTTTSSSSKTVSSILKSLTKIEGQLLLNTLLSPLDIQENHGIVLGTEETNMNIAQQQQQQQSVQKNKIIQLWDDIGGLEDVKESLLDLIFPFLLLNQEESTTSTTTMTLEGQQQQEEEEQNIGRRSYYGGLLQNPPGVLLYGPPGCGKTMLVRALAYTANARFLYIKPSTLLRKYVGETNLYVRGLFSLARKVSPCILFIDEMEGLFRERGGGSSSSGEEHEVNRELKTEFMQLWDGIMSFNNNNNNKDPILVVGATNRPFDVDAAFLRRMPRSFYVGLPDATSRYNILKSMLIHVPMADDLDIESVAQMTERYSPSDLKEVLRTAALFPLREARASMIRGSTNLPCLRPLTMSDIIKALEKVQPTQFSPAYRSALLDYVKRASGGRRQEEDLLLDMTIQENVSRKNPLQPFPYFHMSNTETKTSAEEYPLDNQDHDAKSDEEDFYSSSFDDED